MTRPIREIEASWSSAVDAWMEERYADAEPLFRNLLPLIESDDARAPDFFAYFGQTLERNGKFAESHEMLSRSLESALSSNEPNSVTVTMARLGLSESLFRRQRYSAALEILQPSLNELAQSGYILFYMAARIYYQQGSASEARSACESMFLLAPKQRFKSVDEILARVAAHDC